VPAARNAHAYRSSAINTQPWPSYGSQPGVNLLISNDREDFYVLGHTKPFAIMKLSLLSSY
jgi:hypothetical protein